MVVVKCRAQDTFQNTQEIGASSRLAGSLVGSAKQDLPAAVPAAEEQPHGASSVFVRDEIVTWPLLAVFSACPSSYRWKIQQFQEDLSTCWSELPEGLAGVGGQEGMSLAPPAQPRDLSAEQTEVLGPELSFILLN